MASKREQTPPPLPYEDEVLRRMLQTPPKPHKAKPPSKNRATRKDASATVAQKAAKK